MAKTVFVDGNPQQGIQGTIVAAAFLNKLNNQRHTGRDVDGEGANDYAADTGQVNQYEIELTPELDAHIIGMPVYFKAANTCTGASTFKVNALDPVALKKNVNQSLESNDIVAGQIMTVVYDGTYYQLIISVGLPAASTTETKIGASSTVAVTPFSFKNAIMFSAGVEIILADPVGTFQSSHYYAAHGLGTTPKLMQFILECKEAEYGYSVGDQVFFLNNDSSQQDYPGGWVSATQIGWRFGYSVIFTDKNTGARLLNSVNPNKWKLIARAWA